MESLIPKAPLTKGDNWLFTHIENLIYTLKKSQTGLLQNSDLQEYKIQESDSALIIEKLRSLIEQYTSGKELYKHIFKTFFMKIILVSSFFSTLSRSSEIASLICLDQATTALKNLEEGNSILFLSMMLMFQFMRTLFEANIMRQRNLLLVNTTVVIQFLVMAKQMRSQVITQNKGDDNPIANINNLLTEDLARINYFGFCMEYGWASAYVLVMCIIFLFYIDSHAGGIICGILLASQVYNIIVMALMLYLERLMLEKADLRITLTTDVVEGIKQIKYLSWQQTFSDKIMSIRKQEFTIMLCKKFFDGLCEIFWQNLTYVLLYCYVMSLDKPLDEINVFTLIAVFNTMTFPMGILPWIVSYGAQGYVSLKRVADYLNIRELNQNNVVSFDYPSTKSAILISNTDLSWPKLQQTVQATQVVDAEPEFSIQITKMNIERGTLNFIIGKIGCGKTALLNAILNELDKPETIASASFMSQSAARLLSINGQIVINGTIAYCSQSTWVQNISIRDNILFGNQFDENLYNRVIRVCQLQKDIDNFDKKDLYEVGPDGKRLSGGQKQRITIARALYSNTDNYLFDDIFSSLDVHVADAIFQQAILEFLSEKTVLLVTSHYRYLEQAKNAKVFLIEKGSLVIDQDKINQYLVDNRATENESNDIDSNIEIDQEIPKLGRKKSSQHAHIPDQLAASVMKQDYEEDDNDEERETGKIATNVWMQYFSYMGWIILVLFIILSFAAQFSLSIIDFWLKSELVGDQGSLHEITVYCNDSFGQAFLFLTIISIVITVFRSAGYVAINIRSSWLMFKDLNRSIMFGLMKFFDKNNVGRIISRVQYDTSQIDDELAWVFNITAEATTKAFGLIVGLLILFPYLSVAIIIVIYLYWRIAQIYTNANRELKRLKSVNTGRLLSIMNETINGIKVIRGFNKQAYIESVYISRLNDSILSEQCGERAKLWFNVRLMLLNNLLLVCLISFISLLVVSGLSVDFAACALALTYSVVILDRCNEAFEFSLRTESGMVCVERILQYTKLESEDVYKGVTKPISQCQNAVEFKNISMSYEPQESGKLALNDVSFAIKKGEKVAFVGRTGSGKTSILNALFRLYDYQKGTILIEGQLSEELSLKSLRDQLSVVPQFGFLFNATIKENIDPEDLYDKQTIEDLFTKSDFKLRGATESNTDFIVQPNGTNLSNGEKQVLNFLRIISQDKQIICLDEATSNMDPQTDQLLHNLLFKYVENRTLLVITHRLENIQQYDKIIVMDKGKIVEMGSYQELSANTDGFFNKLKNI